MSKHTPGPWRNCEAGSNFQKGKLFIRPSNGEKLIATIASELNYEEKAANARLIAAAPDLLEALKMAAPYISLHGRPQDREMIYNALSKAEPMSEEIRVAIAKAEKLL